ncbi:PREDICTED: interferon lambda receptor 1 [Condylura cristata]|uniref:interferon lambda receptor 1 n=1 Tax=Condylura cristata TaxID=143302 RepID=UPI00033435FC|nr:PREDICTED: interferon lambda receptor 1 [Condylura cristata]
MSRTSGRPHLAPPQNVTLFSRNFSMYLTWLPGPGNPEDVTYFVAYKSSPVSERWRKVKNCTGTKELECSLMCLEKLDLFNKVKARVRAASPIGRSFWVESKYLEYLFDVEPAPPVLVVTRTKEFLSVNATYQLPHCMPPSNLKYEVAFRKEKTKNKTLFPITPSGQLVQIPLQPTTDESYCLSARTIYTFAAPKYSQFSNPICFSPEATGASWAFLALLLLPVPLAIATRCVIQRSIKRNPWFQQTKKPQTLEMTRRGRLTPRVQAPAGPDGSAEDEDEDEDSSSFQPYLEPPPFLGQELQTPGGPGKPLIQVKESPACGCSDGSWASTVGSSSWNEARSSGYLGKKGPGGPGLGGDKFSEDSASQEELLNGDLPSWAPQGSLPLRLSLRPGEPPISLQTLTFLDSSPEEEEEELEEEEEEDGRESDAEEKGAGSQGAESLWGTEVRGRTLGHYMAR